MIRFVAIGAGLLAAVIGIAFQDDPWSLGAIGNPADQLALAHRDSVYSHVTWAVSEGDNSAELRFFDRVEGGVCLQPSWADLAGHGVDHLAMPADWATKVDRVPAGHTWPAGRPKPNPGSLSHTRYITLYPAGVLLNEQLMARAGGDPAKADPKVLIVGLGSGVGVGMLAHHYPEASITVVDIDRVVNEMVRDHYPMLAWLETQKTSSGEPRLQLATCDARLWVRHPELRDNEGPYDLIIIDAYTSGSTIPPHLMTQEYYEQTASVLAPGGIVLSNIIGSYTGEKRLVLSGAIRSMRAAGLTEVMNFPIHWSNRQRDFNDEDARNNIVLATRSDTPLRPDRQVAGWERLQAFSDQGQLYKELPLRTYTSRMLYLIDTSSYRLTTTEIPLHLCEDIPVLKELDDDLAAMLRRSKDDEVLRSQDAELIARAVKAVKDHYPYSTDGWRESKNFMLLYRPIDWVAESRKHFANSIELAKRPASRSTFNHDGDYLVGPLDEPERGYIPDAPLYTDTRPNADILNH